jgi:hypothetical protein
VVVGDGPISIDGWEVKDPVMRKVESLMNAGVLAFQAIARVSKDAVDYSVDDGHGNDRRENYLGHTIGSTLKNNIDNSLHIVENVEKQPEKAASVLRDVVQSVNLACADLALALDGDFLSLSDRVVEFSDSVGL